MVGVSKLHLQSKAKIDGKNNLDYQREYYEKVSKEKRKQRVLCTTCNVELNYGSIGSHKRSDKHRNLSKKIEEDE